MTIVAKDQGDVKEDDLAQPNSTQRSQLSSTRHETRHENWRYECGGNRNKLNKCEASTQQQKNQIKEKKRREEARSLSRWLIIFGR